MISWNDPSLVLVILIIKTTKTNQKKSHYFFFFFPSLTSSFASTISIPKFAKHFSNEWNFSNNKLGTIDFPFVQEPILSMKYSDIFFFFHPPPRTIHRETSRIPKGVVHFRACHFSGGVDFSLLFLASERSTRVISGLAEARWMKRASHRKINAPRVFRPTKHATVAFRRVCISWKVSRVRPWNLLHRNERLQRKN